jgi:hypothetical protein
MIGSVASFGLYFESNGGDQSNAVYANAPFSFDRFLDDQYDLNLDGYMNGF